MLALIISPKSQGLSKAFISHKCLGDMLNTIPPFICFLTLTTNWQ